MILKYQFGGHAPLVQYKALPNQKAAATTSSSSSDLLSKDIKELLTKLNGLPSDTANIIKTITNFSKNSFSQLDPTSAETQYLSIIKKISDAKFSAEQFKTAQNKVMNNGGLYEIAVDERGRMICVNSKGDYKYLTVEQLKQAEGYTPLKNSELLSLRSHSPKMAFNDQILNVVSNGLGMSAINTMITQITDKLGSYNLSIAGYTKKMEDAVEGLNILKKAVSKGVLDKNLDSMTLNGLYKNKLITKDQQQQIILALNYIYASLPENAKTILKLKADGTEKGAKQLVSSFVMSMHKSDYSFDPTLELDEFGKKVGGTSTTKSDNDLKSSLPLNVMKNIGGHETNITIDKGNGIQMTMLGTYYGQIKSPEGKPIVNTSLQTMLAESGLQSIINDSKNITFGDQKITQQQLANITYNNTGLVRANLPIKEDGTVRLDILESYEKAQNEIKLLGTQATEEQIKTIYEENGLSDLILENGNLNPKKFGAFMIVEGYTTESNGIKESDYIKVKKDVTDTEIKLIEDSLTVGEGKEKTKPDIDTFDWYNPFDWVGVENIYKAAIYIPITNNVNAAVYGADQNLEYDEESRQELKYRNFNKASNMNTTSANVL